MMSNAATSWPWIIRRNTILLITLVILLGVAVTAFVVWNKERSEGLLSLINDYHLASALNCRAARAEIREMQVHLFNDFMGLEEEAHRRLLDGNRDFNVGVLLHIVKRRIKEVQGLQRRFADPRVAFLAERLGLQFSTLEKGGIEFNADEATTIRTLGQLQSLIVTLAQLERLHTVIYGDLVKRRATGETRDILTFIAFVLGIILIGYLSMRKGLQAINSVVEHQKEAEDELRMSEARLSVATRIAKLGHWVWDGVEDKLIHCSEEFARIHGVSAQEYLASSTSREEGLEWAHPDDRERCREVVMEATSRGEPFDVEYRIVTRQGEVRYIQEIGEPVLEIDGGATRWTGTIQDVTERKEAEQAIAKNEEQLRQAQKMEAVGQLTAGVAHDFNNILAVILGNAELLQDELGRNNPLLAAVVRASTRGGDLTQRLLAFSRKQVLDPKIVNVNKLLGDITILLQRTLEEHIEIETVTAAGLWNCEVDLAQLENALVNLAINARDAMPNGGRLTLETANARLDGDYVASQAEVTPGQYVMLAVTDTGCGMPPEVCSHAFEPFFTTKGVGEGSGLGLSMVYGFAKQSGGHATIYSEVGEGTTIKLYFPRSTRAEVEKEKPALSKTPSAHDESVLVVEDDPDVRTLVVAVLSSLGYEILEAATAKEALAKLESTPRVDLLLTDVILAGGMSGRELATEVKQRTSGIKVLYMSGYTENAIVHHGRLDTDAVLLQKPFRNADLARAVRNVLDRPPR